MLQRSKGNTTLIIIIVVLAVLLIAAIAVGTYFWGKSKSSSQTKTTASPTKTATVSPTASIASTPKSNATTAVAEQSARDFVESFMKMTLGTLPGASLDVNKAHSYLSDTMKAQYSGENWVPQFYGIQDGPNDVQFLMENKTEDGYVLKYNALWGGEVGIGWAFTVVKDGDSWFVDGFSNNTQ